MTRLSFPPLPLWAGRDEGLEPERFHQFVKAVELAAVRSQPERQIAFIGFRCDEGVKRNKGRLGAAQGPEYLRRALANLVWDKSYRSQFIDIGDIFCTDGELEAAQKELGSVVSTLLAQKCLPIVLGGGHETAWGHFQGLATHHQNILIINFDAHYDLRPLIDGKFGSSGTPFTQIAEYCQAAARPFSYTCIGIQASANTKSLKLRAKNYGVQTVLAETIHTEGTETTHQFLQKLMAAHSAVYLSICLDLFSQAYAPGVSAPQGLGLLPWQVLPLLRSIAASGKVIGVDMVELCPALDRDSQTARLGAALLHGIFCELA